MTATVSRIKAPTRPIGRNWRKIHKVLIVGAWIEYALSRPAFWPLLDKFDNDQEVQLAILEALEPGNPSYRLEVRFYEGPTVVFGNSCLPVIIFEPEETPDSNLKINYGDTYIVLGEIQVAGIGCRVFPEERRRAAA